MDKMILIMKVCTNILFISSLFIHKKSIAQIIVYTPGFSVLDVYF